MVLWIERVCRCLFELRHVSARRKGKHVYACCAVSFYHVSWNTLSFSRATVIHHYDDTYRNCFRLLFSKQLDARTLSLKFVAKRRTCCYVVLPHVQSVISVTRVLSSCVGFNSTQFVVAPVLSTRASLEFSTVCGRYTGFSFHVFKNFVYVY